MHSKISIGRAKDRPKSSTAVAGGVRGRCAIGGDAHGSSGTCGDVPAIMGDAMRHNQATTYVPKFRRALRAESALEVTGFEISI